jgi:chemotaxis protein CheD
VLRAAGIPIMRESVGGERGRSIRFYVGDGRVEVRSVGADVHVI